MSQCNGGLSTSVVDGGIAHVCGVCDKTFERRDLRNRHKRRCIQSAGKVRVSKRKSCLACVQKKLRCSFDRPSCARCKASKVVCEYSVAKLLDTAVPPSPDSPTSPVDDSSSDQSTLHSAGTMAFTNSAPAADLSTTQLQHPGAGSQLMNGQLGRSSAPEISGSSNHGPREDGSLQINTVAFTAPLMGSPSVLQVDGSNDLLFNTLGSWPSLSLDNPWPVGPQALRQYDDTAISNTFSNTMTSDFLLDQSGAIHPSFSLYPQQVSAARADRSDTLLVQSDSEIATATRSSGSGTNSTRGSSATSTDAITEKLTLHHRQKTVRKKDHVWELIGLTCEYPRLMLQKDFWSPYIHHRMYRCAQSGMAEPLGMALVCISSHLNVVQSTVDFVDDMINRQRQQLLSEFHAHGENLETALASLHAMSIYQIIGMLEKTDEREQSNGGRYPGSGMQWKNMTAELYQSFLLKMTRQLCTRYSSAIKAVDGSEHDWVKWQFAESLRRNIFLVNMINVLAARARKLNKYYYEPLDDELVLDMRLPATEIIWKACAPEDWEVLQNGYSELGDGQDSQGDTIRQFLHTEKDGRTTDESKMSSLTRGILACARIQFAPDRSNKQ